MRYDHARLEVGAAMYATLKAEGRQFDLPLTTSPERGIHGSEQHQRSRRAGLGGNVTCPSSLAGDRICPYLGARGVHVAHSMGVPMSQSLVGPFAAASTAVSALVASAHDHRSLTIVDAATIALITSEER